MKKEIDLFLREMLINWALDDFSHPIKKQTLINMTQSNWIDYLYTEKQVESVEKPLFERVELEKAEMLYELGYAIIPRKQLFYLLNKNEQNTFTHFIVFLQNDAYLIEAEYYKTRKGELVFINWEEIERDVKMLKSEKRKEFL